MGRVQTEAYGYDGSGNRTTGSNQPDTDNRLASDGTYAYTYDNNGNLKVKASGTVEWDYAWDYRNRLTSVTEHDLTQNGAVMYQASYGYDANNQRTSLAVTGGSGQGRGGSGGSGGGGYTWFSYEDGQLAMEWHGGSNSFASATLTDRYLNGPAANQALADEVVANGGSTVRWILADNQGTVRDVANSTGAIIDHVTYDSFGNVTGENHPGSGVRFGYTGQQRDTDTGLDYYQARYYDPATGRFLSTDPASFSAGDANLYRYVGNSPMDATDPSGMNTFLNLGATFGQMPSPITVASDSSLLTNNIVSSAASMASLASMNYSSTNALVGSISGSGPAANTGYSPWSSILSNVSASGLYSPNGSPEYTSLLNNAASLYTPAANNSLSSGDGTLGVQGGMASTSDMRGGMAPDLMLMCGTLGSGTYSVLMGTTSSSGVTTEYYTPCRRAVTVAVIGRNSMAFTYADVMIIGPHDLLSIAKELEERVPKDAYISNLLFVGHGAMEGDERQLRVTSSTCAPGKLGAPKTVSPGVLSLWNDVNWRIDDFFDETTWPEPNSTWSERCLAQNGILGTNSSGELDEATQFFFTRIKPLLGSGTTIDLRGCNTAAGEDGYKWLGQIANLTGAEVVGYKGNVMSKSPGWFTPKLRVVPK